VAPVIIAHRGDSSNFPENTLAAFRGALAVGADLVELDVQLSRDDEVVVIHDGTLDRTTTGSGSVRGATLAQIQALSAHCPTQFGDRFRGERVPTLSEALSSLKRRARVMVEIKKESVDGEGRIEAKTVAEIVHAGMESDVMIISFAPLALRRCLEAAPEIARGHLFHKAKDEEVISRAKEAQCTFVMPEKSMLSPSLCTRARAEGLEVATWVVDDPEELRALAPLGIFGVATNCPGVLLDAIWESE
jgi:glycerophosphoryl diester phosphodiesterase